MKLSDLEPLLSRLPFGLRPIFRTVFGWFQREVEERDQIIADLRTQLNQNSSNSSRPPSSDGTDKLKRAKKGAKKGEKKKKPGGQPGHKGKTLKMVAADQLDDHEDHYPSVCNDCGHSLEAEASTDVERRQVFDIPPIKLRVTEHRAYAKSCPCCAKTTYGEFPNEATNHAVYGPNLRAMAVYLMVYQMLPYARTAELLSNFFGAKLSVGTLDNMLTQAASKLDAFADKMRNYLQQASIVGFDETTIQAQGKQHYAHVARDEKHTLFELGCRGYATMNAMNVLPKFKGIAIHDRYSNYFGYDCEHGLCNAHILRDLQAVIDRTEDRWAIDLQRLLQKMNTAVKRAKTEGKNQFSTSNLATYRQRFFNLVQEGLRLHPKIEPPDGQQKNIKQSKTHNLLIALDKYTDEVLHFLYNFDVPFDNNGSERDVRMLKVKMKISGFFHSLQTGNRFLRIRSFISTAHKQQVNTFDALQQLFLQQNDDFALKLVLQ